MRRVAPAVALYFLAPFVAEYLLGDFTITFLVGLVLLAPMYGGGALLIREVVRRTGRGWPSIVLLAFAYGVFEEGITTQSLFDPNYADAHLLDKGFVPALGIAMPWTLFVLALHTVWSISVPIALAEGLVPARRTTPWLRTPGLVAAAVLFALGSVFTVVTSYATDHFVAPWPRLLVVVLVSGGAVALALLLPGTRQTANDGRAPAAWLVLVVALAAGAVFMLGDKLPAWPASIVLLADYAVVIGLVLRWSKRAGWGNRHRLALAAGGLLTYAWHSFTMHALVGDGPVITPVSHVVFAAVALVLIAIVARRAASKVDTAEPEAHAALARG